MYVQCSDCGEEVLGAANLCWRCGREFPRGPDENGLPPVRQSPLAELATATVQLAAAKSTGRRSRSATRDQAAGPLVRGNAAEHRTRHRDGQRTENVRTRNLTGVIAFLVSLLAVWLVTHFWRTQRVTTLLPSVLTSMLGLSLSLVALNAPRRGLAFFGLILSIVVLATSGFLLLVEVYASIIGVHPLLDQPVELPADELSGDLL